MPPLYEGPTNQWTISIDEARRALQQERFSKARTILTELLSRNPSDHGARSLLNEVEKKETSFREKAFRGAGASGSKISFGPWTLGAIICAWQGMTVLWFAVSAMIHGTGIVTPYEQMIPIPLMVTGFTVTMTPLAGIIAAVLILGLGAFFLLKAYMTSD
jgi:hypothetical protein